MDSDFPLFVFFLWLSQHGPVMTKMYEDCYVVLG